MCEKRWKTYKIIGIPHLNYMVMKKNGEKKGPKNVPKMAILALFCPFLCLFCQKKSKLYGSFRYGKVFCDDFFANLKKLDAYIEAHWWFWPVFGQFLCRFWVKKKSKFYGHLDMVTCFLGWFFARIWKMYVLQLAHKNSIFDF